MFTVVTGSSAVTPVFMQKGDDVMLNLTEADDLENSAVFWNFTDKSSNEVTEVTEEGLSFL